MHKQTKLLVQMAARSLAGFLLMGLLLFGCAGSLRYLKGWLFLATLAVLMLGLGLALFFKAPETLGRRLRAKETQKAQRGYVGLIGLVFLLSFALAGLDYRFHWSRMPLWGAVIGLAFMVFGYALYAAVVFQNAYASRVVEVQEGQSIIETGLYGIVRHPMYLACLVLFGAMPFALGSYVAALPMLLLPVGLVLRIKNEESVLAAELEGYTAYMQKTKYRLIPFLW